MQLCVNVLGYFWRKEVKTHTENHPKRMRKRAKNMKPQNKTNCKFIETDVKYTVVL